MENAMSEVLVILADGFEEVEALAPIDFLKRAGASVTVAALDKKEVTGSRNIKVLCDITLDEVRDRNWDAVVLPGGMPGASNLASSKLVSEIIQKTYSKNSLVCAICASPAVVLAPLGVLENKKAVCYPGMEKCAPNVKFGTEKVVKDGNVITSRGPGCALDFALEIIKALFGKEKADEIASSAVC